MALAIGRLAILRTRINQTKLTRPTISRRCFSAEAYRVPDVQRDIPQSKPLIFEEFDSLEADPLKPPPLPVLTKPKRIANKKKKLPVRKTEVPHTPASEALFAELDQKRERLVELLGIDEGTAYALSDFKWVRGYPPREPKEKEEPRVVAKESTNLYPEITYPKVRDLLGQGEHFYTEWLSSKDGSLLVNAESAFHSALVLAQEGKENTSSLSLRLGEIQMVSHRLEAAEKTFLSLMKSPLELRSVMNLVQVYIHQGRFQKALDTAERAEHLIGEKGDKDIMRAFLKSNQSAALQGLGKNVEAIEYAAEAADLLGARFSYNSDIAREALINHVSLLNINKREDEIPQLKKEWMEKLKNEEMKMEAEGEANNKGGDAQYQSILAKFSKTPFKEFSPSGYFIDEKIAKDQVEAFKRAHPEAKKYSISVEPVDTPTPVVLPSMKDQRRAIMKEGTTLIRSMDLRTPSDRREPGTDGLDAIADSLDFSMATAITEHAIHRMIKQMDDAIQQLERIPEEERFDYKKQTLELDEQGRKELEQNFIDTAPERAAKKAARAAKKAARVARREKRRAELGILETEEGEDTEQQ
ncbi:hypothetical protein PROFUN_00039 [Planoprotostelium fungivorum]|uniref:Uncharacterized protein n=1 Tax=Planoprotostelium fungivorum TaxID=1890364 RepID=A0A2P6P0I3_9EUKA|nr:hypothetical protein PROFUN_00039 [Planoprotostelium fungivorum]